MRIYNSAYELMSEMGRDLWEMGLLNSPKTYQNKVIEGNEEMTTKELICKQYCLTSLPDPEKLFIYTGTKDWANAEFQERISGKQLNPGKAWELNPGMWEEFLVETANGRKFDYTYAERINRKNGPYDDDGTVLEEVIHLLKQDNDNLWPPLPLCRPLRIW